MKEMLDATGEPFVMSVERVNLVPDSKPATLQDYLQLFIDREAAQTEM